MSEIDTTDLVCRARREPLSDEEQRRLMQGSVETRLMSLMLQEFDRESRLQPGDDLLVARMVAHATKAPRFRALRYRRMHAWLAAAAVLLLGAIACAWWAVRPAADRKAAPPPASSVPAQSGGASRARTTTPTPEANEAPVAAPGPSRIADSETAARRTEPLGAAGKAEVSGIAQSGRVDVIETMPKNSEPRAKGHARDLNADRSEEATAASLFARANALRREAKYREALGLYQAIIEGFPRAREAPLARLAVAKLLEGSNPMQALVHYQVLANRRGPLRAEGLWGVAESARTLGQTAVEQRALSELTREFPDSPYAAVARERMRNGTP